MSPFVNSVKEHFGTEDLYSALGVDKSAKVSEIRRAYLRLSLKVHPDRVEPDQVSNATEKFQVLSKMYVILSDKDKRAVYDEDGTIDEEDDSAFKQDRNWTEYWRLLFSKVTIDDIKTFEKMYKGSDEEIENLRSAYVDYEGDMDKILEGVLCSTIDDEPRFRELIQGWIDEGSVPAFTSFVSETKTKRKSRKRRCNAEAREAEEVLAQMGSDGSENSLKSLIKARQSTREEQMGTLFTSLEEKYGSKKRKRNPKTKEGTSSRKQATKKGK